MASRRAAKDSIFMLQANHVDVVEVQEFGGLLIGSWIVLSQRPSHPCRIVVSLFRIVYRQRHQSGSSILRGYGLAQVGGECGDATVPGKIIPDNRDSAGERQLRFQS